MFQSPLPAYLIATNKSYVDMKDWSHIFPIFNLTRRLPYDQSKWTSNLMEQLNCWYDNDKQMVCHRDGVPILIESNDCVWFQVMASKLQQPQKQQTINHQRKRYREYKSNILFCKL